MRAAAVILGMGSLLLLLALSSAADAQIGSSCRSPVLAFPAAPRVYDPGASYNLPFALENPNGDRVENVRADVKITTPDGWTAIPARRELTMGPESVQQNVLSITAPSRGTGAASGNITISVTFTCVTGVVQQSSLPAEHVLDVRMRAFEAPWVAVIGAFVVLALVVGVLGIRRLRRSILLSPVEVVRPILPGKSAKFTFSVHNRRGKPATYHLVTADKPAGWTVHLALDEVDLEPGEEKTLWAIVKAPPTAAPGENVPIQLRLQGERGPRDGASGVLLARVEDGS